jgi:hypothetical protein
VDIIQATELAITLLIAIVSSLMAYGFFRRYEESLNRSTLFLMTFQILFTVTYLFQFLIPLFYDPAVAVMVRGSAVHQWLSGITFTLFISFEVLFMSLFAFEVYSPENAKYLALVPLTVTILYAYAFLRYGNSLQWTGAFYEWIPSPQLQLMMEILALFSFLPGLTFVLYSAKVRRDRRKGVLLASGFLIIALFVCVFDNLAITPPSSMVRLLFILTGLIVVWAGFGQKAQPIS